MRLNVWFFYNESREFVQYNEFPYTAISVLDPNKPKEYKNIEDVYEELEKLYDKQIENGSDIGKGLYNTLPYFVNDSLLKENGYYNTILKVTYCKTTKTPPYHSLDETPALFIDDTFMIHSELNSISEVHSKKNVKANNG